MYHNLHLTDAALLQAHHLKGILLVVNLLMQREEIAFQLQQQTGEGVGIARYVVELIIIDVEDFAHIAQQGLSLEDIRIVVDLGVGLFLFIIFVVDFSNNLFKDIL